MTKSLVAVLLAAGVAHADPSPASTAAPPPSTANRLPSGTLWTTLVAGHGPHPKPTDWIVYYGGSTMESRDLYYLAKPQLATNFGPDIDVPAMAVGEKRRYWIAASGVSSARVEDVELVAILGPTAPTGPTIVAPPSDAQQDASGDAFVIVRAGHAGPHADAPDRVFFDAAAIDKAGNFADLGIKPGTQTLADVPDPAVAAIVRTMDAGEERYVWLSRTGMFLRVTLYSVDKRPQVPPPGDLAHPPATAEIAPGARFVVLAPGRGEPIDPADDVTLDYTVWSPTGRTIETFTGNQRTAGAYTFAEQLSEMRAGERRRIWLDPKAAGTYSEAGRGAVVDVAVVAVHRNIELLPGGVRIRHRRGDVEIERGTTRVRLPLPIVRLAGATLARGVVTFAGENECDMEISAALPLAQLEARLLDADAAQDLGGGKQADAIAAATRALTLAPELDDAYVALARAYLAAGKPHDAAHTLATLAARNPVWVYWQLEDQPDLHGLLGEPELAALRVRGAAAIDLAKDAVLVDRAGRFVAVQLTEGSWGSGDAETRLEVFDTKTGAIVATIPHVAWSYMSQPMTPAIVADVERREREVASWLAALGFAPPKDIEAGDVQRAGRGEPTTTIFAKANLTIGDDGAVRSGTKVLGHTTEAGDSLHAAYWLPAQRMFVFLSGRAGHEGCEATDPVWAALSKL